MIVPVAGVRQTPRHNRVELAIHRVAGVAVGARADAAQRAARQPTVAAVVVSVTSAQHSFIQKRTRLTVSVASAGPYANSLHLDPDQHLIAQFLQAVCSSWHPTNTTFAFGALTPTQHSFIQSYGWNLQRLQHSRNKTEQ